MGDQDELRVVCHRSDGFVVAGDVRFIERSIDLVEDAEGGGPMLEDCEDDSFHIQKLCAKNVTSCQDFSNYLNYGGFPHVPLEPTL